MGSVYSGYAGVHTFDRGRHCTSSYRGGCARLSRDLAEHLRQYYIDCEHCGVHDRACRGSDRLQVRNTALESGLGRVQELSGVGDMGLAIGKGGKNINQLRRMTSRQIEVVEYADTPEGLIRNSLSPARIKEIRVTERPDKKIVVVEVDAQDKAIAIGKNGRTIDKTRLLVKRYFDIDHVVVQ